MFELVERVLYTSVKGKAVCAVLLYLSKAFNSVDKEILLKKKNSMVYQKKISLLLRSYIIEKSKFVNFGGQGST